MNFTERKLQNLIAQMTPQMFPGLTIAIGKDDKILWQGTAGYADAKNNIRIDEDTAFGIGSITKVFVAVLILQLTEEGYLTLDLPISNFLDKSTLARIANAESVTIRHLLSHYSGIPSWENQPSWVVEARGKSVQPVKIWMPHENLDYIRGKKALCLPGDEFHYSNSNFTLLGLIIEKTTSCKLEEELQRRIFHPLLLKNTALETKPELTNRNISEKFHRLDADFKRNAGISHYFKFEKNNILDVSATNLSVEWAAGGIVSTSKDIIKFILALKNGKLLNPQSMQEMQRWAPADNIQMGLSLFRTDTNYGVTIGHGGNVLGYSACAWWYENIDCAVAILTNVGSMHACPEANSASKIFKKSKIGKLAQELCIQN
jgi:D-alanyl-D-alanine carboxypeptidase